MSWWPFGKRVEVRLPDLVTKIHPEDGDVIIIRGCIPQAHLAQLRKSIQEQCGVTVVVISVPDDTCIEHIRKGEKWGIRA